MCKTMLEGRELERLFGEERLPKVVKKAVSIEKEAREGLGGLGPEALRGRVGGPEREREGRLDADMVVRAEAASSRPRVQ